ncbi:MAG: class I SAM-dependent methyltransferase [Gemmobacter sp.]|jgi:SAM-dependent methyltransferase|nr:class I SAM-dependent methyltransferase [Gemmobacter sp.]
MSNPDFARLSLDAETQSFQSFIGAFRRLWAGPLYRALRDESRSLDHQALDDYPAFEAALRYRPKHQFFGWLEHNLQKMKYEGRWGIVHAANAERETIETQMAAPIGGNRLTEDPSLQLPDYYEENDFHQHPGGLREDPLAAVIYRESASAAGGVVGKADLHARYVRALLGDEKARKVIDIGCGFGRSTFAFTAASPDTSAVGVDLSASCVRLSAHLAEGRPDQDRVHFTQADGVNLPFADGGFDLFTSTMLLHEMPATAIRELIAEAFRVLEPGGISAHLDFLPPPDNFLRALYLGHSDRNAEPFMRELAEMDMVAEHEKAGFVDVQIVPFAEDDQGLGEKWRLPWTIIRARKPAGAK